MHAAEKSWQKFFQLLRWKNKKILILTELGKKKKSSHSKHTEKIATHALCTMEDDSRVH